MKTTQKSHRTKLIIIVVGVALLLVACLVSYAYAVKLPGTPFSDSSNNPETSEDTTDIEPENQNPVPDSDVNTDNTDKENLGNETPPSTDGPDIIITALSTSTSSVSVRALISGVLTGNCTATFSKQGETSIVKMANVQPGPSSSTCQGFDVNKSEFSSGQWAVVISYTSGDIAKQTESKSFSI